MRGRRWAGRSLAAAGVVLFAVLVIVDRNRLWIALLAVSIYLAGRMGFRALLARHDAPLWLPVASEVRSGRLDEQLLAETLPGLVHPALRTSVAVALAHVRADRGDWAGVGSCLARMGALTRSVIGGALVEAPDRDRDEVAPAARVMLLRARAGGSSLPREVLFCAGAVLHGRGCYRRAFALGRRAWRASPDPVTAYNCACALARLGEGAKAVDWLRRALDGGYPATDLAADADLESLRHLPDFAALAGSAT